VGPLVVEHLAPTPLPVVFVLIPVLSTALAVALVLRGSGTRRRAAAPRAAPVHARGGIHAPRIPSTSVRASRRPADLEVTGRAWDPTQRRAVAGAELILTVAGQETRIVCDEGGRFATGPLPAEEAVVRFVLAAPGYCSESFTGTVPHHGELRDVRIDLIPIRHRVMEVYRDAALRVMPERGLWGFWTPRELMRFIKSRGETRSMPLKPLTELFEEVYYAGHGATLDHLSRARQIASSIA
jgi:hypothetical protein